MTRIPKLQRDDIIHIKLNANSRTFPASVNIPPTSDGKVEVHHLLEGKDLTFTIGPETEIVLAVLADGTVVLP